MLLTTFLSALLFCLLVLVGFGIILVSLEHSCIAVWRLIEGGNHAINLDCESRKLCSPSEHCGVLYCRPCNEIFLGDGMSEIVN